jgi:hypothetical protein
VLDPYAAAFGWSSWPFRIVVDKEFARIWADRKELRVELLKRLRRISVLPHGTIQLLWADFGAGKSHTLRHLEIQCEDDPGHPLLPVYTEIPVQPEGLTGLFQRLVAQIDLKAWERIAAGSLQTRQTARHTGARDLRQAFRLISSADQKARDIALEWLAAQKGTPHLATLRSYGISSRIDDEDRVVEVMAELTRLVQGEYKNGMIWLIDEFQRVADIPDRRREAFLKAMVSLFNACPSGFHLVLSFSVAQQNAVTALLPEDLQSRAATFPMLALPFLSEEDGFHFLVDLFAAFRDEESAQPHPFTEEALREIVHATSCDVGRITPRRLMETAQSILFEIYEAAHAQLSLPIGRNQVVNAAKRIAESGK